MPLCSNAGHPIPAACGGVDYSGLGSAPSGCPDITSALSQLYSLKPLSSSQYAGCTLRTNTCPRYVRADRRPSRHSPPLRLLYAFTLAWVLGALQRTRRDDCELMWCK